MEDQSIFNPNNTNADSSVLSGPISDADREYVNQCIKEVCYRGDSLQKYQRLIEKQFGPEFYQKCENFVEEVKRSVDRKKFSNTSVINLKYLANEIHVPAETVDGVISHYSAIFEKEEEEAAKEKLQPKRVIDEEQHGNAATPIVASGTVKSEPPIVQKKGGYGKWIAILLIGVLGIGVYLALHRHKSEPTYSDSYNYSSSRTEQAVADYHNSSSQTGQVSSNSYSSSSSSQTGQVPSNNYSSSSTSSNNVASTSSYSLVSGDYLHGKTVDADGFSNIRKEPTKDSPIVGTIKSDSRILYREIQGNSWYEVYSLTKHFYGFMYSGLVRSMYANDLQTGYVSDVDGYTNVRKGPSTQTEIVTSINDGGRLLFERSSNPWFKVFNTEGQYLGYMHSSRIRE